MLKISPSILYPGLVVALLAFSVGSSFFLLSKARSDNGAQILDGYYEQALAWDELQAERTHVQELGWHFELSFDDDARAHVRIVDAQDAPVEGFEANVTLSRPDLAEPLSSSPLKAVAGTPGLYDFSHAQLSHGLVDVVVEGTHDAKLLRFEHRYEVE